MPNWGSVFCSTRYMNISSSHLVSNLLPETILALSSDTRFLGDYIFRAKHCILDGDPSLVGRLSCFSTSDSIFHHFRHKGSPMEELPVNQPVLENQRPPSTVFTASFSRSLVSFRVLVSHPSNVSSFFLLTLLSRSSSLCVGHLHPPRPHWLTLIVMKPFVI